MKKLMIALILFLIMGMVGCDAFVPGTGDLTTIQETTIDNTTLEPTSLEPTTLEPTTLEPTTEEITTFISEDIYLILFAGQDTVEINSEWIDAGAAFVLDDVEYMMETESIVDITKLGLYRVTYNYEYNDQNYNIDRYVMVVDQVAPVVELNLGIDTVKVNDEWVDAGVTVTDNSGEELTAVRTGDVDTSVPGVYVISYLVVDSSGNEKTVLRYVTVIE